MRRLIVLFLLVSTPLALTLVPAAAQEALAEPEPTDEQTGGPSAYTLAENLKDRQVVNAIGEEIGELSNLIIRGDRVTHAIIAIGGFVGLGGSEIVVPFGVLAFEDEQVIIETIASADQIEELTLFDPSDFDLSE